MCRIEPLLTPTIERGILATSTLPSKMRISSANTWTLETRHRVVLDLKPGEVTCACSPAEAAKRTSKVVGWAGRSSRTRSRTMLSPPTKLLSLSSRTTARW